MQSTISQSRMPATPLHEARAQQRPPQRVMTAEEGRAQLDQLTPGSRLYDDIQRALLFPRGIVELSDGSKLNTNPADERLLGGVGEWQVVKFETPTVLAEVCSDERYKAAVIAKSGAFYTIDPSKCLDKLGKVTDLLSLAYASTKGFESNSKVTEIFCDYQSFVKDSTISINDFLV